MFDNSKIFGYARVSTKDQNLERQFLDLKQYVTSDRDIFFDYIKLLFDTMVPTFLDNLKNEIREECETNTTNEEC